MTATIRALYIRSDGGGADALSTADLEILPAVSGIDAMKRLQDERVDCVVVTVGLKDMPIGQFVSMVREISPALPVILITEDIANDDVIEAVNAGAETIISGHDTEEIRAQVRELVTTKRLDRAIEENEHLKDAIREIATSTATRTDRVDIEGAIYEAIMNSNLYEFLWIGEVQDGSISIRLPIEDEFTTGEIVSLVGGDDSSFIERALTEGTVETIYGKAKTRSTTLETSGLDERQTPTAANDESPTEPPMACAAVPMSSDGGHSDLLLMATTRQNAFDDSELDLLKHLGQIAGAALNLRKSDVESEPEDKERAKRFAESLAHELQSSIGIASTHLELGRETNDEDSLDRAESALKKMERTIDSILDIARHDQVKHPTTAPLEQDVETAWESLDDPQAELILEGSMSVTGDHRLIVRALANLFQNAVVHGSESVTVRVGTLAKGFYIEDDGPGIPEDQRGQVFEWGYSTTNNGTGIGLSIVKGIVEHHGWSISISQGESGGARFEVAIPARESAT